MLTPLSTPESIELREFFDKAGYNEPDLRKHLGALELPSRELRNLPRLLDRTAAPTLLNALLRWFWLGRRHALVESTAIVPQPFLSLLIATGLLAEEEGMLVSQAMVLPFGGFLVTSDHPAAFERQESELVLWPNPTSKFLARFAIRRPSRATLDLGTGSGILSMDAAAFSDSVVATDLNERAIAFARFNAWFNGVDKIEFQCGDCFVPVAGRTFDLILSNPPFFITPKSDYMFCDNSMELDQLCRRLVKEAPAHLNEGGYLQMLCEWAQVAGQSWEERIAEWLEGTGCDAWVMKGLTQNPAEYAQHRIKETTPDPSQDTELYDGYLAYYRERGVEAIHDGLIVLRRRTGANWARIEEVPKTPTGDLGEVILSTFAAHDVLLALEGDEQLLSIRPKLSPNVRLEQICDQSGDHWRAESLTLRMISGFPFHVTVQPMVAEFLVSFDGARTAREAIEKFALTAHAPLEQVKSECLSMIRKLIERGFILVPQESVPKMEP